VSPEDWAVLNDARHGVGLVVLVVCACLLIERLWQDVGEPLVAAIRRWAR